MRVFSAEFLPIRWFCVCAFCCRLNVNLQSGKYADANVMLQLKVLFKQDIIVRNSRLNGMWGCNERQQNLALYTTSNPLLAGKPILSETLFSNLFSRIFFTQAISLNFTFISVTVDFILPSMTHPIAPMTIGCPSMTFEQFALTVTCSPCVKSITGPCFRYRCPSFRQTVDALSSATMYHGNCTQDTLLSWPEYHRAIRRVGLTLVLRKVQAKSRRYILIHDFNHTMRLFGMPWTKTWGNITSLA